MSIPDRYFEITASSISWMRAKTASDTTSATPLAKFKFSTSTIAIANGKCDNVAFATLPWEINVIVFILLF
jgi:hypothetical protein